MEIFIFFPKLPKIKRNEIIVRIILYLFSMHTSISVHCTMCNVFKMFDMSLRHYCVPVYIMLSMKNTHTIHFDFIVAIDK